MLSTPKRAGPHERTRTPAPQAAASGHHAPASRAAPLDLELLHLQRIIGNQAVSRLFAPGPNAHQPSPPASVVQRHSTHEHYLLGSLTPDELESIPSIRQQVADAKQNKPTPSRNLLTRIRQRGKGAEEDTQEDDTQLGEVVHLLEQEMARVIAFQQQSPTQQLESQDEAFGERVGKVTKEDEKWQVPMVRIPTKGDTSVICTYGELNTLADMFGNLDDLKRTPAEVVIRMLQGVRQRVYLELFKLYEEIGAPAYRAQHPGDGQVTKQVKYLRPSTTFTGAVGFTGKEKTVIGKVGAVKGYEYVTKEGGSTKAKYMVPGSSREFTASNASAALARNACHFAPETWKTWRRYHEEARNLALHAYHLQHQAESDEGSSSNAQPNEQAAEQAAEVANKALLYSGFGDHFLQDAYASGHLIDKTAIMRWFVDWMAKTDRIKDTAAWAMVRSIATQDMTSNPQLLEDTPGGLQEKLDVMNIQAKDHVMLLMWWRRRALENKAYKRGTGTKLMRLIRDDEDQLLADWDGPRIRAALNELAALGFCTRTDTKSGRVYDLKQEHINALSSKGSSAYKAQTANPDAKPNLEQEAAEFNYVALTQFLDSSYVQKITNYLHDVFCREGLEVKAGNGEDLGRIYGDAAMLTAGGQKGVKYSAETAQKAREAIYTILMEGDDAEVDSVDEIEERFPKSVEGLDLAAWNTALKAKCEGELFEQGVKGVAPTVAKRVATSLAHGKALTPVEKVLEQVAKEQDAEKPTHDAIF